jgi:hypothetical protein
MTYKGILATTVVSYVHQKRFCPFLPLVLYQIMPIPKDVRGSSHPYSPNNASGARRKRDGKVTHQRSSLIQPFWKGAYGSMSCRDRISRWGIQIGIVLGVRMILRGIDAGMRARRRRCSKQVWCGIEWTSIEGGNERYAQGVTRGKLGYNRQGR